MGKIKTKNQASILFGLIALIAAGLALHAFVQHRALLNDSGRQSLRQAVVIKDSVAHELNAHLWALSKIAKSLGKKINQDSQTIDSISYQELKIFEAALPSFHTVDLVNHEGRFITPRTQETELRLDEGQLSQLESDSLFVMRSPAGLRIFVGSKLTGVQDMSKPFYLVAELSNNYFADALWAMRMDNDTLISIASSEDEILFSPQARDLEGKRLDYGSEDLEATPIAGTYLVNKAPFENHFLSEQKIRVGFGSSNFSLKFKIWSNPAPRLADWRKQQTIIAAVFLIFSGLLLALFRNYSINRRLRDQEKEEAARLLRENTDRLNLATSSAGIGVWEYEPLLDEVRWTPSMSHLYGLASKQLTLKVSQWKQFVEEAEWAQFEKQFEFDGQNKKIRTTFHIRKRGAHGVFAIQSESQLFVDTQGQVTKVVGINTDITVNKRYETALKEAEDKFRSAFESAAVGMAMHGTDGRFIKTNEAFHDIIGHSAKDLKLIDIDSLIHPQDILVDEKQKNELIAGNISSYQIEKRLIHQDGHVIWVFMSISAVRDQDSKLLYFIAQIQDITERKRNEAALIEREHFLRTLSECLPGLVSYWGRDLRCHFANHKYESWTGIAMKELRGIHMRQLLGDALFQTDQPYIIGALRGEPQRYERRTKRSDGSWADTLVHLVPDVLYGHVEGFFSLSTDISELKSQQRALENMNQQLVLRTDQAEAASKAKSSFLANMSHEIRTPMNAIMGLMQLMSDTPLNLEQRDYLNKIGSAAEVLLHVINDVLDISRVEANKLELAPERFRLDILLQKTIDLFNYRAQEKGVQLHCVMEIGCPSSLVADRLRLAQILNNLLSNALKFTEKGAITLRVKTTMEDKRLEFSVVDTGIGLSPKEADQLFKPFSQVDSSSSRRFGGAGLGLSICKSLTELMGGEIRVSSSLGKGSTFTFWIPNQDPQNSVLDMPTAKDEEEVLPINRQAVNRWSAAEEYMTPTDACPVAEVVPDDEERLDGKHILIADDHKLNRLVAGEMIKKSGGLITMANDGAEAIEACKTERFDAILMDLQMPEVDGFEATARITEMLGSKTPPIIAVTASATEKDRLAVLAAGMCDHIVKPFRKEDLIRIIREQHERKIISDQ